MNNDIKVKLCQDDFYLMMRNAVVAAGGADNLSKWKTMKLEELVDLFARNGVRMVYMPEKHMNALKIVWGETKLDTKHSKPEPTGRREDGPFPKRKQLLCDSLDKCDEDESWNPAG